MVDLVVHDLDYILDKVVDEDFLFRVVGENFQTRVLHCDFEANSPKIQVITDRSGQVRNFVRDFVQYRPRKNVNYGYEIIFYQRK